MSGYSCRNNGFDIHFAADYYPYGKTLRYFETAAFEEKFLTTQHERDRETGFDYRGARYYDSDLGRFLSLDPLAAKFPAWSAYNYVLGNPISLIDPDGKEPEDIIIRGNNIATRKMEPFLVIKTDLINETIDLEDVPLISQHDPITNKWKEFEPTTINLGQSNVSFQARFLKYVINNSDAMVINFGADIVAGGGIGVSGQVGLFLRGEDAGGIFLYDNGITPSLGFSVGGGIEIGGFFSSSETNSSVSRNSLEGFSYNVFAGAGDKAFSYSKGIKSLLDWTTTSTTISMGFGVGVSKGGLKFSVSESSLSRTLKEPWK